VPELHIITGSNGAGKSTVGADYLPEHVKTNYTVFDGDKLFLQKRRALFPSIAKTHKEARNMANEWLINYFEELVADALNRNDHFAYEGHFTSDATWEIPKRFKDNGYTIHLVFFGLTDPNLSEMRVIERSKTGGHYVHPIEIDMNFRGNLMKLDEYFQITDELQIVDTSETQHRILLRLLNNGVVDSVPLHDLPGWFTIYMSVLTQRYFARID
jgi:predicted ABC-type ATPase